MSPRWFRRVSFSALLLFAACATTRSAAPNPEAPDSGAPASTPQRIVAFGDVHGDLDVTLAALRLAGAIDEDRHWCGGDLIVVQTGDQLDRGDDEKQILQLFDRLADEAAAAGGAFHALNGNHELMNVQGDFRYVTPGGFDDFPDRAAAFRPGGDFARLLAKRDVVLVLGDTVFVHGGVLPSHVEYGVERLNAETRAWLRGESESPPWLAERDSPIWARTYSHQPDATASDTAREVLQALAAKRMVVGHTVQEGGITATCDEQVWCIDVGMAAHYGGPLEVLEIQGDEVRVLRESDVNDPAASGAGSTSGDRSIPPNFIVVFTDDQGYGDLSCFGHPTIQTPNLDRLAAQGMKLTQFVVAGSVCSPSRAALLTGNYPKRVGMHQHVVFPPDDHGLNPQAVTMAEVLKARGYATGIFGKWHLGHRHGLLPLDQGFDTWLGVPYSNDMAQFHRPPDNGYRFRLPLMRDHEVIEWEPDQRQLTRRYTEAAINFLEQNREQPFFLYLPHSMPHIPLYASANFFGGSRRGLYGNVIAEIDWSVGELMATLDRLGIADDTLLLFTSDNGPWLSQGLGGGSAGPLRGGKGTSWEGGHRVPCIVRFPNAVPAGSVCDEPTTALDLMPTFAALAGAPPPTALPLDGEDITPILRGEARAEPAPRPFLYYAARGGLAAIRRGPWKLMLESGALYDLEQDVAESRDRSARYPELVAELRQLAVEMDAEITAHSLPAAKVEEMVFDPQRPPSPTSSQ